MLFFFSWGTGISQALMIRYLISSQFYLTFSLISTYKTRIRSKEYEENIEIFLPQTQDKQRHKEKLPCPSKWALSYQPGSHSLFVLGIPWDCLNSHSTFLMLWSPPFFMCICAFMCILCVLPACMSVLGSLEEQSVLLTSPTLLRPLIQFLMSQWPPAIKLFSLLLHDCDCATVTNCNTDICVFYWSRVTPMKGSFGQ